MSNLYRTSVIANMAHIFSVVTGYVVGTYKQFIPKDYFKTVHIATKIPIAQDQDGDKHAYLKKSKPILSVKPRIEFDFDSEYLNVYFSTMNMFDPKDRDNLNNIFQDYTHEMYLDMSLRRVRFSFDVTIIVETQVQQQNLAYYLINKIEPSTPYYLRDTVIETVIPSEFINEIGRRSGHIDADGKIISISDFVSYLNANSRQPITYKMKTSSGKYEFFTSYLTDAIINFESFPSLDDGETKGQISTNFMISQNCVVDVTVPGFTYFSLMTEDEFIFDSSYDELSSLLSVEVIPIIPLYYEAVPKTNAQGWHITTHSGYMVEADIAEEVIPIHQLFTLNQNRIIKYHSENGIETPFLDVIVYENKNVISTDATRVSVDYTDLTAVTLKIKDALKENSYYFCIYENNSYMNTILKKLEKVDE